VVHEDVRDLILVQKSTQGVDETLYSLRCRVQWRKKHTRSLGRDL
jgi:hypothetical protein